MRKAQNQASTPPLPFPGGMVVVRGREGMAVMVIQGPLLKNSPFLMGKLLRGRLRRCGSMLQKKTFHLGEVATFSQNEHLVEAPCSFCELQKKQRFRLDKVFIFIQMSVSSRRRARF